MITFSLTRSASALAALGAVTDHHVITGEAPPGFAIVDSHIHTPQRPRFSGHPLAADSRLVVEALDDGGFVVGSYTVDETHGEEGHQGMPASLRTHGMAGDGPLGCGFRVSSRLPNGDAGAPFSALDTGPGYEACGFTVSITLRPPAYVVVVP